MKCVECHAEIGTRVAAHRGLHATYNIPPGSSKECSRCHSEHNGEDFPLIKWDPKTLEVSGTRQEIPNDFVWIFAGGTPPNDFLKKIGVGFGARDMALEASAEAKENEASRKQLTQAAVTAH